MEAVGILNHRAGETGSVRALAWRFTESGDRGADPISLRPIVRRLEHGMKEGSRRNRILIDPVPRLAPHVREPADSAGRVARLRSGAVRTLLESRVQLRATDSGREARGGRSTRRVAQPRPTRNRRCCGGRREAPVPAAIFITQKLALLLSPHRGCSGGSGKCRSPWPTSRGAAASASTSADERPVTEFGEDRRLHASDPPAPIDRQPHATGCRRARCREYASVSGPSATSRRRISLTRLSYGPSICLS